VVFSERKGAASYQRSGSLVRTHQRWLVLIKAWSRELVGAISSCIKTCKYEYISDQYLYRINAL
jgi:hypothetical protein